MLSIHEYYGRGAKGFNQVWNTKISNEENRLFRYLDGVKASNQLILESRTLGADHK